MRIVGPSPSWVRFTCQKCKGIYEIEKSDVDVGNSTHIEYGSYFATIACPICNEKDFLSWDFFPASWIRSLQASQQ